MAMERLSLAAEVRRSKWRATKSPNRVSEFRRDESAIFGPFRRSPTKIWITLLDIRHLIITN